MGRRATTPESFWAKVQKVRRSMDDECWERLGFRDEDGYTYVSVNNHTLRAHRHAWVLTNGPLPDADAAQVLHRCDNPPCVNPAHLFVGDQLTNMQDKVRKGRSPDQRGERGPGAALTWSAVDAIRAAVKGEKLVTQKALADQYGVHIMTINDIVHERTWRKAEAR